MKIRLLNDSTLRALKRNIHGNIPNYQSTDTSWMDKYFLINEILLNQNLTT